MAATLEVILKARDEISKVFQNTDVQFSKVALSANKLKTSFNSMLTVGAAVAIGYGIKNITEQSLRFADGIKKTSDQMNMNTTETQTWDFVMRQAGGTVTDLSSSMQKMQKLAYDASTGNKTAAESFKTLGVNIYDSNGALKTSGPLFSDIVQKLQGISNSTERAGIASAIFGKSAKELNPILSMTNAELKAQIDQATEYGQILSEHAVKALDDAGDAMGNFSMSMKVASAEAISNAIPALESLAKVATKFMSAISDVALGGDWLLRGKAEADKKMGESNAITKDLQEWAKLAQEYRDVISTQEALKSKGGSLFSPQALAEAKEGLQTVKDIVSEINKTNEPPKKINRTSTGDSKVDKSSPFNFEAHATNKSIEAMNAKDSDEIKIQEEINAKKLQLADEQVVKEKAMAEQTKTAKYMLAESDIILKEEGFNKELQLLQLKQSQELEMYAGNEAAITAIKAKNANEQAALDAMIKKTQMQNAKEGLASVTSNLKNVAGQWKQFAGVYKAIAIAQATWDTYSAAVASYKSLAGIGPAGPALGAIAAGIAIASGIANVRNIAAAKFARGGDFVTTGPQMIMVGDNPGGRERVSVTPESSPNYNGPQSGGHTFIVNDHSGGFVETFRKNIRSGAADKLVADFQVALGLV